MITTNNPTTFQYTLGNFTTKILIAQCPKVIGTALLQALQLTSSYGYVFMFTDSIANDWLQQQATVYGLLEATKAQVSIMSVRTARQEPTSMIR